MTQTILIVDDDAHIRDVIGFALEKAGFATRVASDGRAGLTAAQAEHFDLIVLDIGLPEMDGLDLCRTLRKTSDVPILFLSARDDEIDRVVGMELGADDYVTKPFSPRELVARIKAILKRAQPTARAPEALDLLRHGIVTLDALHHTCTVGTSTVPLTASEFSFLACLMARPRHVLTRTALLDAVYGANIHVATRTIDSHIRNIRRKLSDAGCPDAIETVHGVGLRMGQCTTV